MIKRYPNRKLYDTEAGRYITLEEVAALICDGHEVRVVDHVSGEDLTALTLAQVVLEQARRRAEDLPLSVLTGLIRAAGPWRGLSRVGSLRYGAGWQLSEQLEEALRRALARRGAATREEFQSLVAQVDALAAEVDRIAIP